MLHEFNRITGLADSTLLVLRPIHWHFFSIKSTDQLPGRLGFEKVLLRCPIYATVSKVLNHLILIVLASSCTLGCILSHWIFFLVGHPGSTFTFLKSSIVHSDQHQHQRPLPNDSNEYVFAPGHVMYGSNPHRQILPNMPNDDSNRSNPTQPGLNLDCTKNTIWVQSGFN